MQGAGQGRLGSAFNRTHSIQHKVDYINLC